MSAVPHPATPVTIVMYHFVRPIARSRHPRIKGLELEAFRGQLDYLGAHHQFIRIEELLSALRDPQPGALPPRPVLLTFDDGYADHYAHVLPLLDDRGLQGSFFPPAMTVLEGRVLDVNKIHFVLATARDVREIVQFLFEALDRLRGEHALEPNAWYYEKLSRDGRYDSPDVLFVKRLLQRELAEPVRVQLTDALFQRYVTSDEPAFAGELYMSREQLRHMVRAGMHVGSHGYDHYWLNTLPRAAQEREIDLSLRFLGDLGVDLSKWMMCYPYGAYDASLLELLRARSCALGFTTEVALADVPGADPLTLPRLDTNDLPTSAASPTADWTHRAGG